MSSGIKDVESRVQACATSAYNILKNLDPTCRARKDYEAPANALLAYSRAIACRMRRHTGIIQPLAIAQLCTEDPRFEVLAPFFEDATLEDLKLLTPSEFTAIAGPQHLLAARLFVRAYQAYFKAASTPSCLAETWMFPTTKRKAETRKVLQEDGCFHINLGGMFGRSETGFAERAIFSEAAVFETLSAWDTDPFEISGISFNQRCLHDADIAVVKEVMKYLPSCVVLDISCNSLLQLNNTADREWILSLLQSAYVVIVGNRRLISGTTSLLQHVARSSPKLLQRLIWLNPELAPNLELRKDLLGDDMVSQSHWETCYAAHKRFYASLGISVAAIGAISPQNDYD